MYDTKTKIKTFWIKNCFLMNIKNFRQWNEKLSDTDFLIIAGPCSAESENQVLQTAKKLEKLKQVKVFRAGIWKPRTSPNNFQGVGEIGLNWLKKVKSQTHLLTTTEVANAHHVEAVLKSEAVDILWLGARTVTNPFSVQEIAEALRGVDIPVMVKNPLHPDLKLWLGAIERLYKVGIDKLAAIHRGFYPFNSHKLRNIPKWEIPINLKTLVPSLPIINDPSHIAGQREFIPEIAQKALDINLNGLMVEVHINPDQAKSDAKQQLTPEQFAKLLDSLNFRNQDYTTEYLNHLEAYRHQIDSIDYQIIELLAQRFEIVKKIGVYKNLHNIPLFHLERWQEIIETRSDFAKKLGLDENFIKFFLDIVHKESINIQSKLNTNELTVKQSNNQEN